MILYCVALIDKEYLIDDRILRDGFIFFNKAGKDKYTQIVCACEVDSNYWDGVVKLSPHKLIKIMTDKYPTELLEAQITVLTDDWVHKVCEIFHKQGDTYVKTNKNFIKEATKNASNKKNGRFFNYIYSFKRSRRRLWKRTRLFRRVKTDCLENIKADYPDAKIKLHNSGEIKKDPWAFEHARMYQRSWKKQRKHQWKDKKEV